MHLFIIGDVHGCYHTFLDLLQYWRPDKEVLIQTGDLVDRGNFVPETVELASALTYRYPDRTVFLKGNHEAELLLYLHGGQNRGWLRQGGQQTLDQYQARPADLERHAAWLALRPLFWENDFAFVSHAGLADTPDPLNESNPDGILWRRGPLRNVGKLQVVGHTPTPDNRPAFDPEANSIVIDTGVYLGRGLTGLKVGAGGAVLDTFFVPTYRTDIA